MAMHFFRKSAMVLALVALVGVGSLAWGQTVELKVVPTGRGSDAGDAAPAQVSAVNGEVAYEIFVEVTDAAGGQGLGLFILDLATDTDATQPYIEDMNAGLPRDAGEVSAGGFTTVIQDNFDLFFDAPGGGWAQDDNLIQVFGSQKMINDPPDVLAGVGTSGPVKVADGVVEMGAATTAAIVLENAVAAVLNSDLTTYPNVTNATVSVNMGISVIASKCIFDPNGDGLVNLTDLVTAPLTGEDPLTVPEKLGFLWCATQPLPIVQGCELHDMNKDGMVTLTDLVAAPPTGTPGPCGFLAQATGNPDCNNLCTP